MKTKTKIAAALVVAFALASCAGTYTVNPDGSTTYTPVAPVTVVPAK